MTTEENKSRITSFKFVIPFVIFVLLITAFALLIISVLIGFLLPELGDLLGKNVYFFTPIIGIGLSFLLIRKKYGKEVGKQFVIRAGLTVVFLIIFYIVTVIFGILWFLKHPPTPPI